jgi:hypothetical protein
MKELEKEGRIDRMHREKKSPPPMMVCGGLLRKVKILYLY